jgi:S-DNA-T family DNA segregation ATPase FtsK/SpoIIIE
LDFIKITLSCASKEFPPMSVSKSKKKSRSSFSFKDERIPGLWGLFFLFLAFYCFLAFSSYLFTWQDDQDAVLRFSFGLLLDSDAEISNILGRLGAITSNFFFYFLFGLPSFALCYVFFLVGRQLIIKRPLSELTDKMFSLFTVVLLFSVIFSFFFKGFSFPMGGGFGTVVSDWLTRFLGRVGVFFLILFVALSRFLWFLNPPLAGQSLPEVFNQVRYKFLNLFKGGNLSADTVGLGTIKDKDIEKITSLTPDIASLVPDAVGFGKQLKLEVGGELILAPEVKVKEKEEFTETLEVETDIFPLATLEINENTFFPVGGLSEALGENANHTEPYDSTLDLSLFEQPVLPLLHDYTDQHVEIDMVELEAHKDQIIETLLHYKIEITKISATVGPTVTLYEIIPAPGVRISKIKNLEDDIALSLSALGIRIIAPIPGKGTIGIEVPNMKKQMVSMKEVLTSDKFRKSKMDLPIALGKTISNEVFVVDLAKMPHLLMAGATGQGKSVGINSILMSLLYKKHPSQVKLVLIDPKKVELFPYSQLEHHFLAFLPNQDEPIITDTAKVIHTLNSLCIEMDNRYDLLKKASVRNIREYNEKFVQRKLNPLKGNRFLPFIVLVIDEFADLIMTAGKEVEIPIGRLAQLARAVGIHLIIATQRPSVNIITGVIKANFPARIAYKVTSKIDSRTILDTGGAEQLIGRGDMLLSVGGEMIRLQGAFIDTPEVEKVIEFIAAQQGYPEPYFLPEFQGDDPENARADLKYTDLDDMLEDAARLIVSNKQGSTSMIQRRLRLGYNRAGRIMDQLESLGIVGAADGSKPREVLIYDEQELEKYLTEVRSKK